MALKIRNLLLKAGHLALIETLATTVDSVGGPAEIFTTSASGVICRVRQLRGDESRQLGKDRIVTDHRIYFEGDVVINESDRITVTNVSGSGGGAHDAISVDNPHGLDFHLQVDTRKRS